LRNLLYKETRTRPFEKMLIVLVMKTFQHDKSWIIGILIRHRSILSVERMAIIYTCLMWNLSEAQSEEAFRAFRSKEAEFLCS
jgi:hypothetical protein